MKNPLQLVQTVLVLCDVLPPIHICLNLISVRLMTGIVTAGLLEMPGNMGVNYPVIPIVK